jgi:hypothetical protein
VNQKINDLQSIPMPFKQEVKEPEDRGFNSEPKSETVEMLFELGSSLREFNSNFTPKEEYESSRRMQAFVRDQVHCEESILPLIDECAKIIARVDRADALHGGFQGGIVLKDLFERRIKQVYNQNFIASAEAFLAGYMKERWTV